MGRVLRGKSSLGCGSRSEVPRWFRAVGSEGEDAFETAGPSATVSGPFRIARA